MSRSAKAAWDSKKVGKGTLLQWEGHCIISRLVWRKKGLFLRSSWNNEGMGGIFALSVPLPITQLMLVTCFLWRSTQMCALWAMVSNNQLFYLSQNRHFIFFCVNWYLKSDRQDNGTLFFFSFSKTIFGNDWGGSTSKELFLINGIIAGLLI